MAGIGFKLRKIMNSDTLSGTLRAYGFAGIISSGPWVLSIFGVLLIGIINTQDSFTPFFVAQFQISVTYLMAISLILTSPLQLLLTRFIADKAYEKKEDLILPNLTGAIFFTTTVTGTLAVICLAVFFNETILYRVLMLASLVILSIIWLVVIVLSGIKAYKTILIAFLLGYGTTVWASIILSSYKLEGLLAGFVLGHSLLLFILLVIVYKSYPVKKLIAFDFLVRKQVFPSLALTGLLYNLAIWIDKFIFWINPQTSDEVISPLRGSELYDLPIFLAYLSIIPGMAAFLLRMETDFVEQYKKFYDAINQGRSLMTISKIYDDMINSIHRALLEITKVQSLTIVILFILGDRLLKLAGISPYYKVLLNIDLVAVGVQVLLLAIFNILFYFDYRREALLLCTIFAASNVIFTIFSQYLGPEYYGYGFASSVLITTLIGFVLVSKKLNHLMYETFMLR